MRNLEHLVVESYPNPRGERRPEQPEQPVVQVREGREGNYEAKFMLSLAGIDNVPKEKSNEESRDEHVAWNDNDICALLTSLADGQALDLNYGWLRQPGEVPRFYWEISGSSTGVSGADALEYAENLFHSLQVVFGNPANGFRFSPARLKCTESTDGAKFLYMLEPEAISIPVTKVRPAGYIDNYLTDKRVIMTSPMGEKGAAFNSVINAGAASPVAFTVSVHIKGFSLSDKDLHIINAAFDQLRTGEVGQIRVEGSSAGRIFNDRVVASTLYRLERWLANPRGYTASCIVEAAAPLPSTLLEIIGSELFRDVPVTVLEITGMPKCEIKSTQGAVNLAGCFHRTDGPLNLLPGKKNLQAVGLPRVYTTAPVAFAVEGLLLGHCGQGAPGGEVRIADADRSRHCYVIGATGTGKSTLLYNMISQDIERGEGLCLIDPHGDLYGQVVNSVPEHRAKDVVLVDLADLRYSVGLNFLECDGPSRDVQMNFVVNELMTIFGRLYNMSIVGGPAFESYMRNALLAVMGVPGRAATLLDVVRFFEDEGFRRYVKERSTNVLAVSFWDRQAERVKGDWDFANFAPYITCKLNQFTHNALLRPIIGQSRSTIDFRKAMDDKKIILVNLAKGILGESDVRLLGMLLIGKIFSAALGRVSIHQEDRTPFYLYVDEFQNLATPTIVSLLSEARKFGLSLIMANQHLGQFSDDDRSQGVTDAILGNVATMLFFRMGPRDAKKLETYTRPYLDSHDLQHLPDHHVACRMLNNNMPVPSFVFKTLCMRASVLAREKQEQVARNIRRRARRVYARKRQDIEETIMSSWLK